MTTYFDKIISYIIERNAKKNFHFQIFVKEFNNKITDDFFKKIEIIETELLIKSPDFEEIEIATKLGKIRSHEVAAVVKRLRSLIKGKISRKVNNLQYTLNLYKYRNKIEIGHKERYEIYGLFHYRIDEIFIEFKTRTLRIEEIISLLRLFFFEELSGAKTVNIKLSYKEIDSVKIQKAIDIHLYKKPLKYIRHFISLKDKEKIFELFQEPKYMQFFFMYAFPDEELSCQITYDSMMHELPVQKRRKVRFQDIEANFHDILNPDFSLEDFLYIIKGNLISGIYVCVRSKSPSEDCLYLVIDIDVSDYIKSLFKPQIVLDLVNEISRAILRTFWKLNLPLPNISLSGGRGVHLILGIERDALDNQEGKVNITNLYIYEKQIPGYSNLKKKSNSCLKDKFKFLKRIVQAICIMAIYNENIAIPEEIKKKLGIYHPYKLFKLSPDSKNEFSVLWDSSVMSKSVFRIVGVHPTTGLVPIPLFNYQTKKLIPGCSDFYLLKEKASVESVITQMREDDEDSLFFQKPNKLTRENLQNLFLPDKLIPYFCELLRFDTKNCLRSPLSFKFWHRFYELNSFYNYLQHAVFNFNEEISQPKDFIEDIENLAEKLEILNKKRIIVLLRQHLIAHIIEYPVLKDRLQSLYFIEFLFKFLKNSFIETNRDDLMLLFSDEYQFKLFLNNSEKHFLIVIETLGALIMTKTLENCSDRQERALFEFSTSIDELINLAEVYLRNMRKNNNREQLLRTLHLVSELYFSIFDFMKKFFKNNIRQ